MLPRTLGPSSAHTAKCEFPVVQNFGFFLSCRVVDPSFNLRDCAMPPPLLSITFSALSFIQGILGMRISIWND